MKLKNFTQEMINDTIVLFPTNQVMSADLSAFGIGIGLSTTKDTTELAPFEITESRNKLIDNYKIGLSSMHRAIPDISNYISDFEQIVRDICDVDNIRHMKDAGFYTKEELSSDEFINEDDLLLLVPTLYSSGEGTGHANVVRIKSIRTNIFKKVFSKFKVETIFPYIKGNSTDNTDGFCTVSVTNNGVACGVVKVYRLTKYECTDN